MIKRFVIDLIQSTIKHNIGSLAATIAFFGFSSLLPVLALLIYITSFFVPEATVARFLQGILQSYVPAIPTGETFALITIQHLTTFGTDISIIGLAGLLWSTIGGFVTLQQTLDTIYEVRKRRPFLSQYVVGFAMMGILLALTIASSLVSAISPEFVVKLVYTNDTRGLHLLHDIGRITFPLILLITCYSCYRVLPSRPLRTVPLIIGSLLATVFIYISRALFMVYTDHLGNYQIMYGALTFVILLTFWMYIVCIILLFGAEVSITIHRIQSEK
jgi:membrane protein